MAHVVVYRAFPYSRAGAFVAGVVEDPFRSGLHLAQVLDGCGVGHAVPYGFAVAQEVVEGANIGLGFEEEQLITGIRFQWSVHSSQFRIHSLQFSARRTLIPDT